ncbi:hypothetical protein N7466_008595 [Penicillium verhagenii]|uniref:uncharacterized protein n=1 Tax=Penicillium verhagenii TaxID=1562060 RepID=UPI002544FF36|nr:uncharacterized protein N7466_008595 [Penicillium verhagenii]KAJ5924408.1 hypothetical protein N7466_008595 [Penicillium verhagenii]
MKQNMDSALAAFNKLNDSVYVSDPEDFPENSNPPLIVLALWMNAGPSALLRYGNQYRRMIPLARIVILRSATNDFFLASSDATQGAQLAPAVDALRTFAVPGNPVFIHLFSNGGMLKTSQLMRLFKETTGKPMPISSMIVDSAPGVTSIQSGMKAISFQLPQFWLWRLISQAAVWVFLVAMGAYGWIINAPNTVDMACRRVNDRALYQPSTEEGLVRYYIYSDSDNIVLSENVEDHMRYSESCGVVVRPEKFKDAQHVMAMRTDPERYWAIVDECLKLNRAA